MEAHFSPNHPGKIKRAGIPPSLTFKSCHSSELVAQGASFDIVISNHVLHHLRAEELRVLIADSDCLSTGVVVHNDIKRDDVAWLSFVPVGLLCRNSFIMTDGLRSIRRAWHPDELASSLLPGWSVETRWPFRLLLTRTAERMSSVESVPTA